MSFESPVRSRDHHKLGLIETMRFQPGLGCLRQERHIARMANSAQYFGKIFDQHEANALLEQISGSELLRVRLHLDDHDRLSVTFHPLIEQENNKVWIVAIARARLQSNNSLLAHKTTLRQTYEAARAEFDSHLVQEVLLQNEHGHLCEGSITNLFVQKSDMLITPPLTDGLLRGVLREELLETGKAREEIILIEDLRTHPFFVGNSLRGLIPARLQGSVH